MEKNKGIFAAFIPLVMTIGIFLVFYSRIECKPNHAGFWFVLVLGMSIGVALVRLIMWFREAGRK